MFVKIFESNKYGQLVVMKDQNDDGDPCVVFYFDPGIEGIGTCNTKVSTAREENRDKIFDGVDLPRAESVVGEIIDFLKNAEKETL